MKQFLSTACLCALTCSVTPAFALEFTGADLNLKYSQLDEELFGTTLDTFAIDAAVEVGFNRNFAAQIDFGNYSFGAIDESGTTISLHGIYHVNDNISLGVFAGQDDIETLESDFYGVEFGYETGDFEIETYYGAVDVESEDGDVFGLAGSVAMSERVDLTGNYEISSFDGDNSFDRYELGVRFNATPGAAFTVGIGSAELEVLGASASDTIFSVGAEFTFGAERGATFGRRGLLKLIPGL